MEPFLRTMHSKSRPKTCNRVTNIFQGNISEIVNLLHVNYGNRWSTEGSRTLEIVEPWRAPTINRIIYRSKQTVIKIKS